jgi:hypothetical protein
MYQVLRNAENREEFREFAREALSDYSDQMGWLIYNRSDCSIYAIYEPQGQSYLSGLDDDEIEIASFGDFASAHGQGGIRDDRGLRIRTHADYADYIGIKWATVAEIAANGSGK